MTTFPTVRLFGAVTRPRPADHDSQWTLALDSVESWTGRVTEDPWVETESVGKVFRRGDLLFGKLRPYLVKVWAADRDGDYIGDFIRMTPRHTYDVDFLRYVMLTPEFIDAAVAMSYGSKMPRTEWEQLRNILIPAPSLNDQRRIAAYLDHETAEIDAFIEEQAKLAELIEEKRRALITQVVSKGLDLDVENQNATNRSSNGTPAHWKKVRLKHLGETIIGLTYKPEDIVDRGDGGTLVLRAGNIQHGRLVEQDDVYVKTSIPGSLRLQSGDIVICSRSGSANLIGKNALVTSDFVGATWGAFMTVLRSPFAEFLEWVLKSEIFTAQIGMFATTTINQLTNEALKNLKIGLPPTVEQEAISAYLNEQTAELDLVRKEVEKAAALAQERRAALISAAVTGKLDVTSKEAVA